MSITTQPLTHHQILEDLFLQTTLFFFYIIFYVVHYDLQDSLSHQKMLGTT